MAENDPPELEDRVERLETGQSTILSKLDELLGAGGKLHAAAEQHEEKRLDRPTEVQEMVRMELEKADRERAAAKAAEDEKSERQQIREQVAKLTEGKPVQPQPRRQRIMWGPQR